MSDNESKTEHSQVDDFFELNVPHATELVQHESDDEYVAEYSLNEQKTILVDAFNNRQEGEDNIAFQMPHPLNQRLVNSLLNKGYSVSQSMHWDSSNPETNHDYTITVSANSTNSTTHADEHFQQITNRMRNFEACMLREFDQLRLQFDSRPRCPYRVRLF